MLTTSLLGRDLLRISDLSADEAIHLLDLAVELREQPKQPLLAGASLGLYFAKHSTRTRVSFSAGMAQLGGAAIPLTPDELQLSRGESLPDTARALSRYLDALAVRTHAHAELDAWAEWATIPVINALTAEEHPCQALADALTIRDRLGTLEGVRVAWVGDGSNVCVSLAELGTLLGYEVVAACPPGYEPSPASNSVLLAPDPREAVAGADVVVTDTWISMGDEHERVQRLLDLEPYRLDDALRAAGVARVMIGTAAFGETPLAEFGDVVVAVDVSDGIVRTRGWLGSSGLTTREALERCVEAGVTKVLCTAVARDGTADGPDLELLREARSLFPGELLAAGGIRDDSDVEEVAALGVDGCVVGRAWLEGKVSPSAG
jgi:ornithine carbamoyltransferase